MVWGGVCGKRLEPPTRRTVPNFQEWEMRATVGVPEPTWRLSASAGDRPVEHRKRLMMDSSLTTCRAADSGLSRLD